MKKSCKNSSNYWINNVSYLISFVFLLRTLAAAVLFAYTGMKMINSLYDKFLAISNVVMKTQY